MAALDFPLLWIEIVGTVADVLLPAQRHLLIGNEHVAFGGVCRKIHSLFAQVADGILVGEFYLWKTSVLSSVESARLWSGMISLPLLVPSLMPACITFRFLAASS